MNRGTPSDEKLKTLVADQVKAGVGLEAHSVTQLPGQASNRVYFRATTPKGSFIVMTMDPSAMRKSEEGGKGGAAASNPFVEVQAYLVGIGVRVPRIYRVDETQGAIVLEDLGDVTLEAAWNKSQDHALYRNAVKLLARMRAAAEKHPDERCCAYQRCFDRALYLWELWHFHDEGLVHWVKAPIAPEARAELAKLYEALADELARLPVGFTHRDYQSRNLMVHDGELVAIDFQDALLAPREYDLVALLRDSYIELPEPFVDDLLDLYRKEFFAASGTRIDEEELRATFDLLTVQRKLKDAGRFEYIHRVKGNPNFLPAIAPSLRYVGRVLRERPQFARLARALEAQLPELGVCTP